MYKRIIDLSCSGNSSCFLWGPRQTGKSTLLKTLFPEARRYDLLLSTEYRRLVGKPELIREECEALGLTGATQKTPIIVDEVQKVPELIDEIHWLIENRGLRFVLCGSSARRLRRSHGNLMGGRLLRRELHPLASAEIPDFSLARALNNGLMPRHYMSDSPGEHLQAYVGDYLKEEIAAEAVTRNVPAFSRFLEVAALSNGEMVNFTNIARDCGVSAPTAKEYFHIIEDTLLGSFLPAYCKRAKRRVIETPRFFFFDVGIVAQLTRRGHVGVGTELFGRAFEHLLFMEITAHAAYSGLAYPVFYWRTASQIEVDFVLGDHEVAIEVKSTERAHDGHLTGLRAFKEEHSVKRAILVSMDQTPRRTHDGIDILPWRVFLDQLWEGRVIH